MLKSFGVLAILVGGNVIENLFKQQSLNTSF